MGRESELGELRAALEAAGGGDARAVLLAGESGIGKSRLVGEVVIRGTLRTVSGRRVAGR